MAEKTEIMTEEDLKRQAMEVLSDVMNGIVHAPQRIEVAQDVLAILKDDIELVPYRYSARLGREVATAGQPLFVVADEGTEPTGEVIAVDLNKQREGTEPVPEGEAG